MLPFALPCFALFTCIHTRSYLLNVTVHVHTIHVHAIRVYVISVHAPLYTHLPLPPPGSLLSATAPAVHTDPVCSAVAAHTALHTAALVRVVVVVVVVLVVVVAAVVVVVGVGVVVVGVVVVVVVVVVAVVVLVCTMVGALRLVLCHFLFEISVVCNTASSW